MWDEALPHFLHPTEELYGLMEKYIKLHNIPPFNRDLQALAQAVKAKRKGAYEQAQKVVDRRLDAALAVAKKFMTPVRNFTVRTAIEVLRVAQSEYEASMEDGKFVKPVEYQDSRGFVLQAERMFEGAAAELARIDKGSLDQDPRHLRQAQDGLARPHAARQARARCRRDLGSHLRHRAAHLEVLMGSGRSASSARGKRIVAFAGGLAAGFATGGSGVVGRRRTARSPNNPRDPFAALKAKFVRPTFVPQPADNPPSPARIALGKRLFEDKELSSTGTVACASCHDPKLSFSDGEPRGKGITGKRLVRHTPSLWNVAFSPLLFWDGRAASLEEQVRFPVEHPDEMGDTLDNAVHRFARHESYERDFAAAFPG